MTAAQAAAEFQRLCAELGKDYKKVAPEQTRAYLRVLMSMSYERGRAAVTHLVDTWAKESLPPPGAITRAAQEVSLEGYGGAEAYSQDVRQTPWHRTNEGDYAYWRQQKLVEMSDEEYWRYLFDRGYRREKDGQLRHEWQSQDALAVGQ